MGPKKLKMALSSVGGGRWGRERAYWKKMMSSGWSSTPGQKPCHCPISGGSSGQLSDIGDSSGVPQRRLKDNYTPHWLKRMEFLIQAPIKKPGWLRLNLCRTEAADARSSEPAAKQGLTSSFHGDVVYAGGSEEEADPPQSLGSQGCGGLTDKQEKDRVNQ